MPLFKSGGFRLTGQGLMDGEYRGVWNARSITINRRPWTMIKTTEKVIGWRAVKILILNGKVVGVTQIPTAVEIAGKVDTRAVTIELFQPAIAMLIVLKDSYTTYELTKRHLKLLVERSSLKNVVGVLTSPSQTDKYQIWAPKRVGGYYQISIVWPTPAGED